MSARARRPTDRVGSEVVDVRGEYAPRRAASCREPVATPPGSGAGSTSAVDSFEQDPTEETRPSRFAVEQATPTEIDRSPGEPGAVPRRRGAERSEPIRMISMKDHAGAPRRRSEEMHAPLHVQLRSMAEVSRRRHDTPVGLGNLAPPRDPRQASARRLRADVGWACVAIALAGAISSAIWLIAGR